MGGATFMDDKHLLNEMRTFAAMTARDKYDQALTAVTNNLTTICILTLAIYIMWPILYQFVLAFLFLLIKAIAGKQNTIDVFNTVDMFLIADLGAIFLISIILVGFCSLLLLYTMGEEPQDPISKVFFDPFLRLTSCIVPLIALFLPLLVLYLPITIIPILGPLIKLITIPFLFTYLVCFIFYLADEKEATTQEAFINTFYIIIINLPSWALATFATAFLIPALLVDKTSLVWGPIVTIFYVIFFYTFITLYTACLICFMAVTYHQSNVRLILNETEGSWK